MVRFTDLNYHVYSEYQSLKQVVNRYHVSFEYLSFLKAKYQVESILHLDKEDSIIEEGIGFRGFNGRISFFYIPFKTHNYLKQYSPDVVLVQGLKFPLQVIFLRIKLGAKPIILVQHHGEVPYINPIKRFLQKLADNYIDGYLFTSLGNAEVWLESRIIQGQGKCFEVLEASTHISKQDKGKSKIRVGLGDSTNFLWVGRLNENKDPLTVLRGFEKYCSVNPSARLYMIYQDDDLLLEVKNIIDNSGLLKNAVNLVGRVEHHDMQYWYSAADFYLSGSHREGSGYALLECMACSCIPVATNIPSFRTITENGNHAFLYEAGNANALAEVLCQLDGIDKMKMSRSVQRYFEQHLSFRSISERIYSICESLLKKR